MRPKVTHQFLSEVCFSQTILWTLTNLLRQLWRTEQVVPSAPFRVTADMTSSQRDVKFGKTTSDLELRMTTVCWDSQDTHTHLTHTRTILYNGLVKTDSGQCLHLATIYHLMRIQQYQNYCKFPSFSGMNRNDKPSVFFYNIMQNNSSNCSMGSFLKKKNLRLMYQSNKSQNLNTSLIDSKQMIRHVSLYLDDGQMEKKVYSEPYFFGSFKKNGQSNEITVLTKI